ncbi:glycosyltransferase family 39 protein [Leptotrichia trevisanii]|uniref:ArnT family glycosyltransferase n=1 Tax=Leptotrichia trevisanii TaxID=109328 RepID=UPI0026EEB0CE|nr:glycosyltransferase family 39 protein [Leptotrichia trevisanii]
MKSLQKILNRNKYYIITWLLLMLITIPLIFRTFTPRDELKYVVISENILKSKNFFVYFVNGELYTDKPPLYFWIIILSKFIFGWYYTYGIVLFNIFIETFLIVKVFKFLQNKFNNNIVMMSIFITVTSILQYIALIMVRMDIFLSAFITLALINFYECYEKNDYGKIYRTYIYVGMAFLFKGLVGILTPLLVIILFKFIASKKYRLKDIKIFQGVFIIMAFVLFWLLPAYLTMGDEFINNLFFKQVFSRTVTAFIHKEPFYFYILMFPVIFFPWTVSVIYAIYQYAKDFFQKKAISDLEKFLILWTVITVFYLSLASSKLYIYLLPIILPSAILTAIKFDNAKKSIKSRIVLITIIIFIIAYLILFFINSRDFVPFKIPVIAGIFVVVSISIVLYVVNRKKVAYFILGMLLPVTALFIGLKINQINENIGFEKQGMRIKYKVSEEILDKVYKNRK